MGSLVFVYFLLFFLCVQIKTTEREEKKYQLVDAGFNLSYHKVLATDYFKVNI